jgi:hypothetical protein
MWINVPIAFGAILSLSGWLLEFQFDHGRVRVGWGFQGTARSWGRRQSRWFAANVHARLMWINAPI